MKLFEALRQPASTVQLRGGGPGPPAQSISDEAAATALLQVVKAHARPHLLAPPREDARLPAEVVSAPEGGGVAGELREGARIVPPEDQRAAELEEASARGEGLGEGRG
jgi:hypothetical protein